MLISFNAMMLTRTRATDKDKDQRCKDTA